MNPSSELEALLDLLVEHPEEQAAIEERIIERFAVEKSVMVVDMTGFTS